MFQVIILAGGMGKRMKSNLPKVLVNFKNKPMIIHIIEQANTLNPTKIIIVIGSHSKNLVINIIKNTLPKIFNKISFVEQKVANGTGDAIKYTIPELIDNFPTLILNGDVPNISANTLSSCFNLNAKNTQILAFTPENNFGYGRIIQENNILKYIREEKDCNDEERKIIQCNTGIYCISFDLLKKYLDKLDNKNKSCEFYLTDIFSLILKYIPNSVNIVTLKKENNNEVYGINTQEQLKFLESVTC